MAWHGPSLTFLSRDNAPVGVCSSRHSSPTSPPISPTHIEGIASAAPSRAYHAASSYPSRDATTALAASSREARCDYWLRTGQYPSRDPTVATIEAYRRAGPALASGSPPAQAAKSRDQELVLDLMSAFRRDCKVAQASKSRGDEVSMSPPVPAGWIGTSLGLVSQDNRGTPPPLSRNAAFAPGLSSDFRSGVELHHIPPGPQAQQSSRHDEASSSTPRPFYASAPAFLAPCHVSPRAQKLIASGVVTCPSSVAFAGGSTSSTSLSSASLPSKQEFAVVPYRVGQELEVLRGNGSWSSCRVCQIEDDGWVLVEIQSAPAAAGKMKKLVPPVDLRVPAVAPRPAAVPTYTIDLQDAAILLGPGPIQASFSTKSPVQSFDLKASPAWQAERSGVGQCRSFRAQPIVEEPLRPTYETRPLVEFVVATASSPSFYTFPPVDEGERALVSIGLRPSPRGAMRRPQQCSSPPMSPRLCEQPRRLGSAAFSETVTPPTSPRHYWEQPGHASSPAMGSITPSGMAPYAAPSMRSSAYDALLLPLRAEPGAKSYPAGVPVRGATSPSICSRPPASDVSSPKAAAHRWPATYGGKDGFQAPSFADARLMEPQRAADSPSSFVSTDAGASPYASSASLASAAFFRPWGPAERSPRRGEGVLDYSLFGGIFGTEPAC